MRSVAVIVVALALAAAVAARAAAPPSDSLLPPSFAPIQADSAGGSVWQGWIPWRGPRPRWPTLVYLPPFATREHRYPVVYLLHGIPGAPYSFVDGLRVAAAADALIGSGALPPFVAVMPSAGAADDFRGEWTGVWERYVVHAVVPWVDAHLPVRRGSRGRALAGLSAGGYGAVDIGLRHPRLFGTLESWSGSFDAPTDGALAGADERSRAEHDPTLLVREEAPLVRRLGVRFYLSAGSTRDRATAALARAFAAELAGLRLRHELVLAPGGHDGAFWRAQLPAALGYALGPARPSLRASGPTR